MYTIYRKFNIDSGLIGYQYKSIVEVLLALNLDTLNELDCTYNEYTKDIAATVEQIMNPIKHKIIRYNYETNTFVKSYEYSQDFRFIIYDEYCRIITKEMLLEYYLKYKNILTVFRRNLEYEKYLARKKEYEFAPKRKCTHRYRHKVKHSGKQSYLFYIRDKEFIFLKKPAEDFKWFDATIRSENSRTWKNKKIKKQYMKRII